MGVVCFPLGGCVTRPPNRESRSRFSDLTIAIHYPTSDPNTPLPMNNESLSPTKMRLPDFHFRVYQKNKNKPDQGRDRDRGRTGTPSALCMNRTLAFCKAQSQLEFAPAPVHMRLPQMGQLVAIVADASPCQLLLSFAPLCMYFIHAHETRPHETQKKRYKSTKTMIKISLTARIPNFDE